MLEGLFFRYEIFPRNELIAEQAVFPSEVPQLSKDGYSWCVTYGLSPRAAWHLNKGVSHRLLEVQADSISFKQHGSSCQGYSDGPSHMRLVHVRVRDI
jgi:hypothetical protein